MRACSIQQKSSVMVMVVFVMWWWFAARAGQAMLDGRCFMGYGWLILLLDLVLFTSIWGVHTKIVKKMVSAPGSIGRDF
jgi:hypothetical protein